MRHKCQHCYTKSMPGFLSLIKPLSSSFLDCFIELKWQVFIECSELTSTADTSLMFSDKSQYCRHKWVWLWAGGCQDKLMMQVAQVDPFHNSDGGAGVGWFCQEGCLVTVHPCHQSSAENKTTSRKTYTHKPKIFKIPWSYVNAPSSLGDMWYHLHYIGQDSEAQKLCT